jgi:hypothetical protein
VLPGPELPALEQQAWAPLEREARVQQPLEESERLELELEQEEQARRVQLQRERVALVVEESLWRTHLAI